MLRETCSILKTALQDISRGNIPKAARRILDVISLIQTGRLRVVFPSFHPLTLLETLSQLPTIHIDHEVR